MANRGSSASRFLKYLFGESKKPSELDNIEVKKDVNGRVLKESETILIKPKAVQEEIKPLKVETTNITKKKYKYTINLDTHLEDQPHEILEGLILYEIEKNIKDLEQQLKIDKEKIQIIEKKSSKNLLLTEVEDDKKEVDELLDQIKKVKETLESLVNSDDLTLLYSLHDTYLNRIISTYIEQKSKTTNWKNEKTVILLQDYISLIDRVIILEKKEKDVSKELTLQEEDYTNRDNNFEYFTDEKEHIKKITLKITQSIEKQIKQTQILSANISKSGHIITREVENTIRRNHLFENIILMRLITTLKPTPANILLGGILINRLARNFQDTFKRKTEITIEQVGIYHSFEDDIIETSNDLLMVKGSLKSATNDVLEMKEQFLKELGSYVVDMSEYQKVLDDLDGILEKLSTNEKVITSLESENKMILDIHKEKVKHYQDL